MSDEPMIGFGGGDEDDMPPEMKDHMLKAFAHQAGLGPHPGMYQGPPRRRSDDPTDTDMQRAAEEPLEDEGKPHEAGYRKMKAAQTGGPMGLGPSEFEQTAAQQTGAMQQQAATAGAVQAGQAQAAEAAQASNAPPPAPVGPAGTSAPYPAERQETPPGVPEAPGGKR